MKVKGGEEVQKYISWLEAENKRLREALTEAKALLDAADCPQCREKSGWYYDNQGEVCQCQWCYEVQALKEKQ